MEELEERPFLRYLMSINDSDLKNVYEYQSCVPAIFRMLPPVAQKCVMYLLYQNPNNMSDWKTWTKSEHQLCVLRHLELLRRLHIIQGEPNTIRSSRMQLNMDFRMHFISSFLSDALTLSQIKPFTESDKAKKHTAQDIFKKSLARLCHLAIPSDSSAKDVSNATKTLFQYAGLCSGGEKSGKEPEISSTGFQFLLLSRNQQIWHYIINYMRLAESQGEDLLALIEVFCRLSLCVNSSFAETLNPLILVAEWNNNAAGTFVSTLRELGLIFIRKRKDGWFFVTPLMASLFSMGNGGGANKTFFSSVENAGPTKGSSAETSGFIVMETNFRLYAYTCSTLQLAIISTFAELVYRFSNFAIGVVTRESVRKAFQTGITAKQIIQYLRSNAHSQTFAGGKIPTTVSDQIYLWEQERKRATFTDGVLYSTFKSEYEYLELRDFAVENKIVLWFSDERKIVIVHEKKDQLVRDWWHSRE